MNRNLSTFERVVRPLLGLLIGAIALTQPQFGLVEGIVTLCALFLILNGLLARCYLWRWLGLNTARNDITLCAKTMRNRPNENH